MSKKTRFSYLNISITWRLKSMWNDKANRLLWKGKRQLMRSRTICLGLLIMHQKIVLWIWKPCERNRTNAAPTIIVCLHAGYSAHDSLRPCFYYSMYTLTCCPANLYHHRRILIIQQYNELANYQQPYLHRRKMGYYNLEHLIYSMYLHPNLIQNPKYNWTMNLQIINNPIWIILGKMCI